MKRIACAIVVSGFLFAAQAAMAGGTSDDFAFRPEAPRFVVQSAQTGYPLSSTAGRNDYPVSGEALRSEAEQPAYGTYQEYADSQAARSDDFPTQVIGAH